MAALFYYSIKLSICLGVIYLFYQLALRNLTFYNWNRWFLLIGSGLCSLIPLVNVVPFLGIREVYDLRVISIIPTLNNLSSPVFYAVHAPDSFLELTLRFLPVLFGLGILIQGSRLII